jgi:hypothetical protein
MSLLEVNAYTKELVKITETWLATECISRRYSLLFKMSFNIILSVPPCLYRRAFSKSFCSRIRVCRVTAFTSDGYWFIKSNCKTSSHCCLFNIVRRVFELHVGMVLAEFGIFREHLLWWHTYTTQLSLLRAVGTFTGLDRTLMVSHENKLSWARERANNVCVNKNTYVRYRSKLKTVFSYVAGTGSVDIGRIF